MSPIVEGQAPPKAGPELEIVQLRAGQVIEGVILSQKVWGVMTHWNDHAGKRGRSERCTRQLGSCAGCERQMPTRWKGYVHYFDFEAKREKFCELTPAAFEMIDTQCPKQRELRGLRIRVRRSEGGSTGRLRVELTLYSGDLERLPPERNPEPFLETLWNWRR
jgi:hypothetical protein